jgi:hypothetical protein
MWISGLALDGLPQRLKPDPFWILYSRHKCLLHPVQRNFRWKTRAVRGEHPESVL